MGIDISLVPLNELVDEVINRGDTAVVMVIEKENHQLYFNWVGDYYRALGVCSELENRIKEDRKDSHD